MTTKLQNLHSTTPTFDPYLNHIDYRGVYSERRREPLDIDGFRAYSVVGKRIAEPFALQLHSQGGELTEEQQFHGVKRDNKALDRLLAKQNDREKEAEAKKVVAPMKKQKKLEDLMRGFFQSELDKRMVDQNSQYLLSQMTPAEKRAYLSREAERARYMKHLSGSDAAVRQDNATRQATLDYFNIPSGAVGPHNPSLLELYGTANAPAAGGTVAGAASGGSSSIGSAPSLISLIMSSNASQADSLLEYLDTTEDPEGEAMSHGLVSDLAEAYYGAEPYALTTDEVIAGRGAGMYTEITQARIPGNLSFTEQQDLYTRIRQLSADAEIDILELVDGLTAELSTEDRRQWVAIFEQPLRRPDHPLGALLGLVLGPTSSVNVQRDPQMRGGNIRPLADGDTLAMGNADLLVAEQAERGAVPSTSSAGGQFAHLPDYGTQEYQDALDRHRGIYRQKSGRIAARRLKPGSQEYQDVMERRAARRRDPKIARMAAESGYGVRWRRGAVKVLKEV